MMTEKKWRFTPLMFQFLFPPKRIVTSNLAAKRRALEEFQFLFPPKRIVTLHQKLVEQRKRQQVSVPFSSEEDRDPRFRKPEGL